MWPLLFAVEQFGTLCTNDEPSEENVVIKMNTRDQQAKLNEWMKVNPEVPSFPSRLEGGQLDMAKMTTLQINVGKMCNQTCKHCHVDAGPTRKEIMTRETMEQCLRALDAFPFAIVDLTGGAPEMNPQFRWFIEEISKRGRHVIDRCNLTIIESNEKYHDLPEFFAHHKLEVVSSLPSFDKNLTDRQRGDGVFKKSICALKKLNAVGYGRDPALILNLVYNPNGAFLPGDQQELEAQFKSHLQEEFGIVFNNLYTIANMPISRFLEYLIQSDNLSGYMSRLNSQFNPAAVKAVMCRSMISVGWDGKIYDCDFNQMLDMPVTSRMHIADFDGQKLSQRKIVVGSPLLWLHRRFGQFLRRGGHLSLNSLDFILQSADFVELKNGPDLKIDLRYASINNFSGINLYGPFNRAFLHKITAEKLDNARESYRKVINLLF